MREKIRYIPKHIDGYYIDVHCARKKYPDEAVRFHNAEEVYMFLNGMYGPEDPENYSAVPLKITYEEVKEDGQDASQEAC